MWCVCVFVRVCACARRVRLSRDRGFKRKLVREFLREAYCTYWKTNYSMMIGESAPVPARMGCRNNHDELFALWHEGRKKRIAGINPCCGSARKKRSVDLTWHDTTEHAFRGKRTEFFVFMNQEFLPTGCARLLNGCRVTFLSRSYFSAKERNRLIMIFGDLSSRAQESEYRVIGGGLSQRGIRLWWLHAT